MEVISFSKMGTANLKERNNIREGTVLTVARENDGEINILGFGGLFAQQ